MMRGSLGTDRLKDLQHMAGSQSAHTDADQTFEGDPVMNVFFSRIRADQENLKKLRHNTEDLHALRAKVAMVTTSQMENEAAQKLDTLLNHSKDLITSSKDSMKALVQENAQSVESPMLNIRKNMTRSLISEFQGVIKNFELAEEEYKTTIESKTRRQLEFVLPNAEPEDIDRMLADNQTTQTVLREKMVGQQHATVLTTVDNIQKKYSDIARLESSIVELVNLMRDLAVMVESQGCIIENVAEHVGAAKENVEIAQQELISAKKWKEKKRKKMWCLIWILVIVLIIICAPLLIQFSGMFA